MPPVPGNVLARLELTLSVPLSPKRACQKGVAIYRIPIYDKNMIKASADKDTEALFNGNRVRRFVNIEAVARRKLAQLHAAAKLDFLRVPPGNRLELLKGNRAGQYSIRINDQFRVCFCWQDGDACEVQIVDYH